MTLRVDVGDAALTVAVPVGLPGRVRVGVTVLPCGVGVSVARGLMAVRVGLIVLVGSIVLVGIGVRVCAQRTDGASTATKQRGSSGNGRMRRRSCRPPSPRQILSMRVP